MKTEIRIYKKTGHKQKKRIAKMKNEKVGFFAWCRLYFKYKKYV